MNSASGQRSRIGGNTLYEIRRIGPTLDRLPGNQLSFQSLDSETPGVAARSRHATSVRSNGADEIDYAL